MTKFQKIQIASSIIPVFSTAFVTFVTMFDMKRRKASFKHWVYLMLIFFLSGIVAWLVTTFLMTGQHLFLNYIVTGLIFFLANYLMVELQMTVAKEQTTPECSPEQETKKRVSNKTIVWVAIVAGIVLSAIMLLVVVMILISGPPKIEDMNGIENTNLATITVDEVINKGQSYTAFVCSESLKGERTDVTGNLEKFDYDCALLRSKSISGVAILNATKTTADQLVLEINSEVKAGNMEIVITVDGEYYQSVAVNQTCTVTLSGVANKVVLVKMGAESAEMEVTVNRFVG